MVLGTTSANEVPRDALESADLLGVIIPWAIVLVLILLIGFFGLTWLSRRFGSRPDLDEKIGFTLEDLRQMRDRGELTDEEFQRARSQMIEQIDPHVPGSSEAAADQGQTPKQ